VPSLPLGSTVVTVERSQTCPGLESPFGSRSRPAAFFCDTVDCCRKIFTERLTPAIAAYARRTSRLDHQLRELAFALGGEAGARIVALLTMAISPATLLRLIRGTPGPEYPTPRVLGVDEWAKCKGQSYGTILVDLEQHHPVDLLPEATPEAFAQWLRDHPGVEIISRDRGSNYKVGATQGAPDAIQVADRFHLLLNLSDALKRMLDRHAKELRETAKQIASTTSPVQDKIPPDATAEGQADIPAPVEVPQGEATIHQTPLSQAQIRYQEVKTLQGQGWSQRGIAAYLNLHRQTVHRYMAADRFPERTHGCQSVSTVTPYLTYLKQRWLEGRCSCIELWQELRGQGYKGSYSSVWRAVSKLLGRDKSPSAAKLPVSSVPQLSARRVARLLVTRPEDLTPEEGRAQAALCGVCTAAAAAYPLAQGFGQMVRERQAEALDAWLVDAERSPVPELRRFATSLRSDYPEVNAALLLPWSNGQTEGQVHRLKLIKRQMYGRANFDLLRLRVLHRL
jgi:transposase